VLAWTAEPDDVSARFGQSVASAGDVNADGYDDVIVGALLYGPVNGGQASVYLGSAGGLGTAASWSVEGDAFNENVGSAVASAGDVDGDGFDDVIVGVRGEAGSASVYRGRASGLEATPAWTASGGLGWSVASAGDVNADGYVDVIAGLPYFDSVVEDEGRASLYLGSVAGPSASPDWVWDSAQEESSFGWSVASAGDGDADGFADVIVGAPLFDVDGAPDGGRVWTFRGSAAGLAAPDWAIEGGQPSADLGTTVASAGDVDRDGYDDVIVGADRLDGAYVDEGAAFVYHGSAEGLATIAGWTSESNQLGARYGYAVAGAGDVTGDGYADVLVGSYRYDNRQFDEGRVSLFLGSATGLADNAAFTAESDQAGAEFGTSVAAAGDVNGDGYGDIVVGASLFANDEINEGRAFLYTGACYPSDADNDGVCTAEDCDDTNASMSPELDESCGDALDNNCDGSVDEGCGDGVDTDDEDTDVDRDDPEEGVDPGCACGASPGAPPALAMFGIFVALVAMLRASRTRRSAAARGGASPARTHTRSGAAGPRSTPFRGT